MKKLLTVLLAVIVLAFGVTFMSYNSDVKGSSKEGTEITVDIPEGTYASKVGEILRENGVIKTNFSLNFTSKLILRTTYSTVSLPLIQVCLTMR